MRDFTAVQQVRSRLACADGHWRQYEFTGLLLCGQCGRRMHAGWLNSRPGYRCRHGYTSVHVRPAGVSRTLCWREDHLVGEIIADANGRGQHLPHTAAGVATSLRSDGIVVVCSQQTVELWNETTVSGCSGITGRSSNGSASRHVS